MVGTRVSHYRVVAPLGEEGMGGVYLAEDEQLGRRVGLKFIAPSMSADPLARARLIREARTAGVLDHPNIATVYEAGEWNGQLFVAMAYYPGDTLKARIARGRLPVDEAARYAEQIASGLSAAHAANISSNACTPKRTPSTSCRARPRRR